MVIGTVKIAEPMILESGLTMGDWYRLRSKEVSATKKLFQKDESYKLRG